MNKQRTKFKGFGTFESMPQGKNVGFLFIRARITRKDTITKLSEITYIKKPDSALRHIIRVPISRLKTGPFSVAVISHSLYVRRSITLLYFQKKGTSFYIGLFKFTYEDS